MHPFYSEAQTEKNLQFGAVVVIYGQKVRYDSDNF